jgi:hypothetical protein
MGGLPFAALLLALALVAFVVSIGIGILLGRRLDRIVEKHAASQSDAGQEVDSHE